MKLHGLSIVPYKKWANTRSGPHCRPWHADCALPRKPQRSSVMKRSMVVAATLAFFFAGIDTAQAAPRSIGIHVSFGAFYRPLAAYGRWIEVESGYVVWQPVRVRPGWRPYMEGRWVWTDYGWYWVSSEPFGWAVFHYGRWYYDDFYGWVWMPDDVWGPAWVEWRYNDSYIGWAPLTPYASFHIAFGIRFTRAWIAPSDYWCFVDYHRFGQVTRYRDYTTEDHSRRLIGTTRSGAGYEIDRNRVVNRGVERTYIEQRSGGRIERTEIRAGTTARGERIVRGSDRQSVVETFRPSASDFERSESPRSITRGERRLNLDMDKVERPQRSIQSMELPRRQDQPERQPAVRSENRHKSGTTATPQRSAPRVAPKSAPSGSRKLPERAAPSTPSRKKSSGDGTRRHN